MAIKKVHYLYNEKMKPITEIYKKNKKRRGRSRYLLSVEVFFKVCKSYLKLSKECNSLSYDAMTAHTAVVFFSIHGVSGRKPASN